MSKLMFFGVIELEEREVTNKSEEIVDQVSEQLLEILENMRVSDEFFTLDKPFVFETH